MAIRLGLGWIFLWAFFDKLLGLGFATAADKSWLAGNSPTLGFLQFGTTGPLAGMYQAMAGNVAVDMLFMLALLLLGVTLILGIANRLAGYAGALLMLLMYTALLLPKNNPLIDEHIIYLFALLGIAAVKPGKWYGLGDWWARTGLVKRFRFLE